MSEAVARAAGLEAMVDPAGIAVVGVSQRETNLGLRFTRALVRHGYAGTLSAVNRRGEDVDGIPGYTSLGDVPKPLDLVIVAVAADAVLGVIEECGVCGVAGALVFTSGFAEVGGDGSARQQELVDAARRLGVRLLGPNSVGFANVHRGVVPIASGFGFRPSIEPGSLAIVTQSGGVAGLLGERAQDIGIGLSYVITTGNEADVTAAEAIQYLVRDGVTREIVLYLEAVRAPGALAEALCAAAQDGIGTAVFKAGSGASTAAAAAAHTGAVVGDDDAFDAFCRQTGACRVFDLDDLFLAAPAMSAVRLRGAKVGILSTSGGAAVAVADAIERAGLDLPPLAEATVRALGATSPGFASRQNPIDISGTFVVDLEQFTGSLRTLEAAAEFDSLVMVQTVHPPELSERIADAVIEGADPSRLLVIWIAGSQSAGARVRLRRAGFAVAERPGAVALALRSASDRRLLSPPCLRFASGPAPEPEAPSVTLARLQDAGGRIAPMARCCSPEAAAGAAEDLGFPVVLKVDAAAVTHKTEHGGVVLGLGDRAAVADAYRKLAIGGRAEEGLVVQRSIAGSRELLVAARQDLVLGMVLVIGFGGIHTEAVGRAAVVIPPVSPQALEAAVRAAGLDGLLGPFRGARAVATAELASLGEAVLGVAIGLGDVAHLELNPVLVDVDGLLWAVDALVDPRPE